MSSGRFPKPVTLVYDKITFTPAGPATALLLAEYLRANQHQVFTLTGNVDERGSDNNMELGPQSLHILRNVTRHSTGSPSAVSTMRFSFNTSAPGAICRCDATTLEAWTRAMRSEARPSDRP